MSLKILILAGASLFAANFSAEAAAAWSPERAFFEQRLLVREGVDDLGGMTVGQFIDRFRNTDLGMGKGPTLLGWRKDNNAYVLRAQFTEGPIQLIFRRGPIVLLRVVDETGRLPEPSGLLFAQLLLSKPELATKSKSVSGAEPIQGAFGFNIGDPIGMEYTTRRADGYEQLVFEVDVAPERQSLPFVTYYVAVTPVSHRIMAIGAKSEDFPNLRNETEHPCGTPGLAVAHKLVAKYGNLKDTDKVRLPFEVSQGNRSVRLSCSQGYTDNLQIWYLDKALGALEEKEKKELERTQKEQKLKEAEKNLSPDNM